MIASLARRPLAVALAVGLGLSLLTMKVGFALDDYKLLADADGLLPGSRPLDYFNFAKDPALVRQAIAQGPYPWWTLPEIRLAFLRPLSSLLILFDARFLGRAAWAFHLHSILWFLLVVAAAWAFYRRVLPHGAAVLALFLFTLDDVHWLPVAWLANRNALVASAPAIFGLAAYLRFREEGWKPGRWLAVLGMIVGLAGGEAALAYVAFFVAYELFSKQPARERALALAPILGLVVVWAGLYRGFGYGAFGSAAYIDPGATPLQFLAVALPRALTLLGALTLKVSADLGIMAPWVRPLQWAAGAIGTAMVGLALKKFWPVLDEQERRTMRWITLGTVLCLIPALAAAPADRLLFPSSLGAMAIFGVLLRAAWKQKTIAARTVVLWLGLAMVIAPPGGWVVGPIWLAGWARAGEQGILGAKPEDLTGRVVLLTAGDFGPGMFGPLILHTYGRPHPQRWWPVSMDPHAHRLARVAQRSLSLEVIDGRMNETVWEGLFRGQEFPLRAGDTVPLDGALITVLAVDEGKTTRLRIDFDLPLSEYKLMVWKPGGFERIEPPLMDQVLELPLQLTPMEVGRRP